MQIIALLHGVQKVKPTKKENSYNFHTSYIYHLQKLGVKIINPSLSFCILQTHAVLNKEETIWYQWDQTSEVFLEVI